MLLKKLENIRILFKNMLDFNVFLASHFSLIHIHVTHCHLSTNDLMHSNIFQCVKNRIFLSKILEYVAVHCRDLNINDAF